MFWPQDIWGKYANSLEEFKEPGNRLAAVRCLNEMVVDALRHLPHCVTYMEQLNDVMVFRFCAIPQIMAAGTLSLCFNNGGVFQGVVKVRRGQTATIFDSCSNMADLMRWFLKFLAELKRKVEEEVEEDDPILEDARAAVASNINFCERSLQEWSTQHPSEAAAPFARDIACVAASAAYSYYAFGLGPGLGALPPALAGYQWVLTDFRQLHQLVAAVLLILTLWAAVLSKR